MRSNGISFKCTRNIIHATAPSTQYFIYRVCSPDSGRFCGRSIITALVHLSCLDKPSSVYSSATAEHLCRFAVENQISESEGSSFLRCRTCTDLSMHASVPSKSKSIHSDCGKRKRKEKIYNISSRRPRNGRWGLHSRANCT